jgi:hypothetical protein
MIDMADWYDNQAGPNANDSDWNTEDSLIDGEFFSVRYNKPVGVTGAIWHLKVSDGNFSYVLYDEDFNNDIGYIQLNIIRLFGTEMMGDGNDGMPAYYHNFSTDGKIYEEGISWLYEGWVVNFTSESQLNLTFNLTHATETHFASWNTVSGFWDVVLNATGNTSGLVVVDNTVNTSGTNEYAWRPLLGVNGEWWVWVNQTGLGNGTTVNITKVIPMEIRQTNPLVVGGPLLLAGVVMGLIFNRRRRQRKDV